MSSRSVLLEAYMTMLISHISSSDIKKSVIVFIYRLEFTVISFSSKENGLKSHTFLQRITQTLFGSEVVSDIAHKDFPKLNNDNSDY